MVSVIVPVYNTPIEFLNMCVKSIATQTEKNIELLLIDDGSKEEIAKELDLLKDTLNSLIGGVKVVHKKNGGVSSARNLGIEKAQGEYIIFVDSDDIVHRDFVKALLFAIEQYNVEMAVCDLKSFFGFNDYEKEYNENNLEHIENEIEILEGADIYKRTKGYVWNRIYKKTAINNIRFNENISFGEDGLFLEDVILKIGKCAWIDRQLYFYRANGFGTSNNMSSDKYLQAMYMVNKQLENPYVKADIELSSKRLSVRELYRIKYMVALEAEKTENYKGIIKEEIEKLIDNINETWASDSEILKISQRIFKLKIPFPVGVFYLKSLRLMQKIKQFVKKYQWKKFKSSSNTF